MENKTPGWGRNALIGLVAGLSALVAPSLSGCGPSPDQATINYVKNYAKANELKGEKEILESYNWDNDHSFRKDLKYFNDNLRNIAWKDFTEKHGFYKGRKLNDTDKAAAAKRFRAWAENGRNSF